MSARGLSSTTLPAKRVVVACVTAIAALLLERRKIQSAVEAEWLVLARKEFAFGFLMSEAALKARTPPSRRHLYEGYRESDEHVLTALAKLAAAADDAGQNFTMVITADDFRLIQEFYHA